MDTTRRERLRDVMAAMAVGDTAMVFSLVNEFGDELEKAARYHVRSLDLRVGDDDIKALVNEFAMALFDAGGAWRADGGALPWVWASRRLRQIVIDQLLPPTFMEDVLGSGVELGDETGEGSRPLGENDDTEWSGILAELAVVNVDARRVWEECKNHNPRNVEVFISYRIQQAQGDPAPSETVAEQFGLTPANVRQIAKRMGDRLGDLVAA